MQIVACLRQTDQVDPSLVTETDLRSAEADEVCVGANVKFPPISNLCESLQLLPMDRPEFALTDLARSNWIPRVCRLLEVLECFWRLERALKKGTVQVQVVLLWLTSTVS